MTLTKSEWQRLRWPIGALLMTIVAMATLVQHTQSNAQAQDMRHQDQVRKLNEAKSKFRSSGQEKETIIRYLPEYQRLIEIGFVGEEKRIEWLDALRSVHEQARLFKVDYSIDKQSVFKTTLPLDLGPFTVQSSTMTLSLDMLHEGDLLTLLDGLNASAHAPYILRQCEIRRLVTQLKTNVMQASFQASCELDWITLHEPLAPAGGST